jgi:hypothetical protein
MENVMRYQISECIDQNQSNHEIIEAETGAKALQLADSVPIAAKSWPSMRGEGDTECWMLGDPDNEAHCWSADAIEEDEVKPIGNGFFEAEDGTTIYAP